MLGDCAGARRETEDLAIPKEVFYPRNVGIELVRGCAVPCPTRPIAPQASGDTDEPLQFMDLTLLEQIATELDRWPTIETIRLSGSGDPLLHPDYHHCLEILGQSKVVQRLRVIEHLSAGVFGCEHVETVPSSLGVYRGCEATRPTSASPNQVFGGCPFVEDDSLYLTVDGRAQPCPVVPDPEFNVGRLQDSDLGTLLNDEPICELRRRLRLDQRDGLPYCRCCPISLGGDLGEERLREFWIQRDEMGMVDDRAVRRYLFETLVPTEHRTMRLDLGCGKAADPGFLAADRFPLPGVDVVLDFDADLPFRDNSFDLIYASHSLEHARDLPALMREIYRIAEDRAQVCIVAPYYFTSANLANPYHHQVFTEDTPRFWSDFPSWEPGMEEVARCPQAPIWGLSKTDHSDPGFDFRCLNMTFAYFPEYRDLSAEQQRRLRHSQLNVCDQIMYHLLVVKSPLPDGEQERLMRTMQYYVPPYVKIRVRQEHIEALQRKLTALESEAKDTQIIAAQLQQEMADLKATWVEQSALMESEAQQRETLAQELALAMSRAAASEERVAATEERLIAAEERTAAAERHATVDVARLSGVVVSLQQDKQDLSRSRLVRWVQRSRRGPDWRTRLSAEFQPLLDDSVLFGGSLQGFILQPSSDLSSISFLPFQITLGRSGWSGVTVAPLLNLPGGSGYIGLEIVSPDQRVITHERIPMNAVQAGKPLRFSFAPIAESGKGTFEIRVFVKETQGDIRVLEWRKPSFAGLRPPVRRLLCAIHFQ